MTPHEEAAHLASAFRQMASGEQMLKLVRRIRAVAVTHLDQVARRKTVIERLYPQSESLSALGKNLRLPKKLDLSNIDVCVLLSVVASRAGGVGAEKAPGKALIQPSEKAAIRLLRACDYALEAGHVPENIRLQILHAYSGLEDTSRVQGAKWAERQKAFGTRRGTERKNAAVLEHSEWRKAAMKVWSEPGRKRLSASRCASIVVKRLALKVKADHVSRVIADLKPSKSSG